MCRPSRLWFACVILQSVVLSGRVGAQTAAVGDIARHAALGGGGIAIRGGGVSTQVNPAGLAGQRGVRVLVPRIVVSGDGPLNRAILRNVWIHGDLDHLDALGVGLLKKPNQLRGNAEVGIQVNSSELTVLRGAQLLGDPNASLRLWARQGSFGIPPPEARFVTQYGDYQGFALSHACSLRVRSSRLDEEIEAGVRLLVWSGEYQRDQFRVSRQGEIKRHRVADHQGRAVDLDLGLRWTPTAVPRAVVAIVARGVLATDTGRMEQPWTLDLGASWRFSRNLLCIVDASNVFLARGFRTRFILGCEWELEGSPLVLRVGLTPTGPTAGLALGAISLAIARDGTGLVSTGVGF